ncbi:hypothetical protein EVAR_96791_1 [Eumeta japonica]|uniref:Uncharacterized protein n=1 Tax=Eumeta variegata TaxID=151549 RepID=A0A4C1SHR9_EUMVA|nr:hypothetical protein EVAR_96791_1 [Eumeta japonica]
MHCNFKLKWANVVRQLPTVGRRVTRARPSAAVINRVVADRKSRVGDIVITGFINFTPFTLASSGNELSLSAAIGAGARKHLQNLVNGCIYGYGYGCIVKHLQTSFGQILLHFHDPIPHVWHPIPIEGACTLSLPRQRVRAALECPPLPQLAPGWAGMYSSRH